MNRPITTLFMLMSVDGKISPGASMKSITLQGLVSLLCMDPAGYLMWRNAKGI